MTLRRNFEGVDVKTALIILSLFGCDDAGASCQSLAVTEARFESVPACEQQIGRNLEETAWLDFPMVLAHCGTAAETEAVAMELAAPAAPDPQQLAQQDVASKS
jgi:hypothetical protein